MFTKKDVKQAIEWLGLTDNHAYMIYMGGSLCMHGVKQNTNDLDIVVNSTLFESLSKIATSSPVASRLGNLKFTIDYKYGDIEVFEDNNFEHDIIIIDGISCQNIQAIKAMKRMFGREKDIKDLHIIEEYEKSINNM